MKTGGVQAAQQLASDLRIARNPRRWTRKLLRGIVLGIRPAVAVVRNLPRTTLELTTTGAGVDLRSHLAERRCGIPTGRVVSVLALPQNGAAYLKGKKKQALRTNSTKATADGVGCHHISNVELRAYATQLLAQRSSIADLEMLLAEPDGAGFENWVALDSNGDVVAIARLQVDQTVAWLKYFVAVTDTPQSLARYKLSAEVFIDLADRGVQHVIVGSAVFLTPGLSYFQRRLGFEATRADVTAPISTTPGSNPTEPTRPGESGAFEPRESCAPSGEMVRNYPAELECCR